MEAIIGSIITGSISLIGVIVTIMNANKKTENQLKTNQAVTDTKIEELTREVREHNGFARRMPVVEETKDVYSTSEVKTNKVWIDGRPIYRKVYYYSTLSFTSSAKTLSINLPNLHTVCDFAYNMYYPTTSKWYAKWDAIETHNVNISSSECSLGGTSTATFTKVSLIFEYTKTTDSETSSSEVDNGPTK